MHVKKDFSKCPDGQIHDWASNGGFTVERKTNRAVSNRKCSNCGLAKQVFEDSGRRVNR